MHSEIRAYCAAPAAADRPTGERVDFDDAGRGCHLRGALA
jgi:hypothetical protein